MSISAWRGNKKIDLPILQSKRPLSGLKRLLDNEIKEARAFAREAHDDSMSQIQKMSPTEALGLVRKQPKRNKNFKTAETRNIVRRMVDIAKQNKNFCCTFCEEECPFNRDGFFS